MKKIRYAAIACAVAVAVVFLFSCSSDDASSTNAFPPDVTEALTVDFHLQNNEGVRTTSFHCGENIVFHLLLHNVANQPLQLPAAKVLLGDDLFRVYAGNGTDIRTPWDEIMTSAPYQQELSLAAGDSVTLECAWDYLDNRHVTPPLYSEGSYRPVLASGEYYSIISLKVDSTHFICQRVDFTVQGDVNPTTFVPSGEMQDVFSMQDGGIQADFCLKNEQGEQVTTFSEGDDIIFDLTLTNLGSTTFRFEEDIFHVLGNDLFRVFSVDGQDRGTSWFFGPAAEGNIRLASGKQLHYQVNRKSLRKDSVTEPLLPKAANPSLGAGKYFVIAPVNISKEIKLFCVINFEIESR